MTLVCDSILRTSLTTDEIGYSEYVVDPRGHLLRGEPA